MAVKPGEAGLCDPTYDERKEVILDRLLSKKGLRPRIDANCVNCIYESSFVASWRSQIEDCTDCVCVFHEVRAKTRNK